MGWEVTCKVNHEEETQKKACRSTLRFNKHGGAEFVERLLKFWCLHASEHKTNKSHHDQKLPSLEALPSMAELDDMAVEASDIFVHRASKRGRQI